MNKTPSEVALKPINTRYTGTRTPAKALDALIKALASNTLRRSPPAMLP
jgi:hypothetical protein